MKPRFFFTALGLVAVLLKASCTPAVTNAPFAPSVVSAPATATPADLPAASVPASTQVVEVQAIATSRGPKLEATDPATVSLASGQLQLVEFFRFT
jgi:hypothetical protein